MKIFGSITELVSAVFRSNSQTVTLDPPASPSGSRTLVLPDTGSSSNETLAGLTATQTLSNKTMGSTNTLTGSRIASFTPDGSNTLTAPAATDTLVGRATSDTLTNKVLSGNTATNLVNGSGTFDFNSSGTLTAPNATDTLVAKNTTDTLTNKTLSGNTASNLVNGSGTLNLNSSGTITVPNATDTLVGKATTDTLTNKTLTAPVIATIVNSGTLTLPTSTDTLVGRATTDTLTNKTLTGQVVSNFIDLTEQASAPASPGAGILRFYSTTSDTIAVKTSGGTVTSPLLNPMTTLGDIIYEDNTPAAVRLAGNTTATKNFLTQTGTGSVSAAPAWGTIAGADVPVVVPGTSNGVVSSSGVPGNQTGNAIAASYIGEFQGTTYTGTNAKVVYYTSTSAFTSSTSTLIDTGSGIAKGIYLVFARFQTQQTDGTNRTAFYRLHVNGANIGEGIDEIMPLTSGVTNQGFIMNPLVLSASSNQIQVQGSIASLSGSSSANHHQLYLVRVG